MRRLFSHGAEDVRLEGVTVPRPGGGEVLLRTWASAGLHHYTHGGNGENLVRGPFTPGHELSAVVEADPGGSGRRGPR